MFVWYLGNLSNIHSNSSQKLSFKSSVLSSAGAWIFRTIWNKQPLSNIYNIPLLTNSTLLTADMTLTYMVLIPFSTEKVYSAAGLVPLPCHLISYTATKSNLYQNSSFKTVIRAPPYTNALCSMFQFSCLYSVANLFRQRIHPGLSFLWLFVTSLFLWWGIVSPTPNPQAGARPLVICPWLLINYIPSPSS
jgi:hypothetical protein